MMKKLYLLIFFASMAFLLAGCPPKETPAPDLPPPDPACEGEECPCEGMECDEEEEEEKEQVKEVVDQQEEEPEKPKEPEDEVEDEPELKETIVVRTPAQAVEEPEAQAVEEPETELKETVVIRTPAQVVEQKKEEELIVEEKDADESVQPPKAEEIMILPPEESEAAFSEMGMVYFAYDKSEITADFEEVIQKNYEWINQNPDVQIQLEGHCDERGTNEYNLALGVRRAKSVFDYLVSLGASPSQFTIVSFGEERPAVYGSNESSWRQNRRVEFTQL